MNKQQDGLFVLSQQLYFLEQVTQKTTQNKKTGKFKRSLKVWDKKVILGWDATKANLLGSDGV